MHYFTECIKPNFSQYYTYLFIWYLDSTLPFDIKLFCVRFSKLDFLNCNIFNQKVKELERRVYCHFVAFFMIFCMIEWNRHKEQLFWNNLVFLVQKGFVIQRRAFWYLKVLKNRVLNVSKFIQITPIFQNSCIDNRKSPLNLNDL